MTRLSHLLAVFTLALLAASGSGRAQTDEAPLIGVTSIAFSADIQAIVDGMRDRLAERGLVSGRNISIHVRDAGADGSKAEQVVREFDEAGARMIVAITTPSIRTALEAGSRIPVVGAGLPLEEATALNSRYRRRPVTGIADSDTQNDQFALIRLVAPEVNTVAVPVDPARGELSAQLKETTANARSHNIAVVPLAVSIERNAIDGTVRELNPNDTALLLDRKLLPDAPVEALAAAAGQHKLRLFAADEESVIRGALAAMVVEPFGIGQQLGDVVADILERPSAARLPFQRARASHLVLNEDGRALIDVAAIEESIAKAQRSVIDWAEGTGPRPRVKPAIPEPPPPLGVVRGIKVPTPRSRPPIPER